MNVVVEKHTRLDETQEAFEKALTEYSRAVLAISTGHATHDTGKLESTLRDDKRASVTQSFASQAKRLSQSEAETRAMSYKLKTSLEEMEKVEDQFTAAEGDNEALRNEVTELKVKLAEEVIQRKEAKLLSSRLLEEKTIEEKEKEQALRELSEMKGVARGKRKRDVLSWERAEGATFE